MKKLLGSLVAIAAISSPLAWALAPAGGPPSTPTYDSGVITTTTRGNNTKVVGSFVVPDKPGSGYDEMHVRIVLTGAVFSNFGENLSSNVRPPSMGPWPANHSFVHFRIWDHGEFGADTGFSWTGPDSNADWPTLFTGESFVDVDPQPNWDFTFYYDFDDWAEPMWEPGERMDVVYQMIPFWTEWGGFQNDPTGEYPYGYAFDHHYQIYIWWEQQPQ